MFTKAVKHQAKGRVALIGPAGAGKSRTMLYAAKQLAGRQGKIAAIDTEHGSLEKEADLFDFDICKLTSFSAQNFLAALKDAEAAGYAVFCCDSLSHFWMGKGGALEFVDDRRARHKDQMGGWKDFRPHERAMVDAMLASPCHVLVTMRTKTAYDEVTGEDGKKKRVKVGLAPVQREGLEYEFDLVGYMDEDHNLVVDKTRCSWYAGKTLRLPNETAFAPFAEWLHGAPAGPQAAPKPEAKRIAPDVIGGKPGATLPVVSNREAIEEIRATLQKLGRPDDGTAHFLTDGKRLRLEEMNAVQLDRLRHSLLK